MKFFSFVRDGFFLNPVEVQVNLLPGLPEVKFSGLVDMAIKESATRLKSAFRKAGFQWPSRQQIIINLSPSYIKKSSPGMDLALASAILWNTGQMNFSHYKSRNLYCYGELSLNGEISAPEDWKAIPSGKTPLVTGRFEGRNFREGIYSAENLKSLGEGIKIPAENWESQLKKPKAPDWKFSPQAALILKLAAAGEHGLLLCGESGSGKTTLTESLYHVLSPPDRARWEESVRLFQGESHPWRPYINPHHTITPLSMIGGGSPLFPGEISNAHGGQLVLDEYLEFHPKVQEALREPVEKGKIRLVRRGQSAVFPARFLLTAATNLCPCGDYIPGKSAQCSYSLRKCQSYLDRLSGPMLDRFDLLAFSHQWKGKKTVTLESIGEEVEAASRFRLKSRGQKILNSQLELADLESQADSKALKMMPQTSSHRRKRALLRAARTLADLKGEEKVGIAFLEEAFACAVKNFYFLKNRMLAT